MKPLLLVLALLSFSFTTLAQDPPAPQFIGETIWGCTSFSAKKRWTKVPGAEFYQVRIDSGSWIEVGSSNSYTFPLTQNRNTRLYVRAFVDSVATDYSRASVRQTSLRPCDLDLTDLTSRDDDAAARFAAGDFREIAMAGATGDHDMPLVQTCLDLPDKYVVRGIARGTQCQQVGTDGIGSAELIAQGFLDAIDVWGIVEPGVQVCFREQGALKFLRADSAPRAVSDLAAQRIDGLTCGFIDSAGTVALMRSPGVSNEMSAATADTSAETEIPAQTTENESQPESDLPQARGLVDCPVTASDWLNLRQGPGLSYPILREIPYQTRLTASQRAGDWFMVEYEGDTGWVSASFVSRRGSCTWA